MPAVRDTMARKIGAAYKDMDLTMTTLPADDVAFDPQAFRAAISLMNKGDVVTIFTPDDTHFEMPWRASRRASTCCARNPS